VRDLPRPDVVPSPPRSASTSSRASARLRLSLPWLVALAAVLLMLMVAAVTVRRHVSLAAPIPGSQTTATASPQH
jgi:hypothetical protein